MSPSLPGWFCFKVLPSKWIQAFVTMEFVSKCSEVVCFIIFASFFLTVHMLFFNLFDVFRPHFLHPTHSFQTRRSPDVLVSLLPRPLNAQRSHENVPHDGCENPLKSQLQSLSQPAICNSVCHFCITDEGKVTNKMGEWPQWQ